MVSIITLPVQIFPQLELSSTVKMKWGWLLVCHWNYLKNTVGKIILVLGLDMTSRFIKSSLFDRLWSPVKGKVKFCKSRDHFSCWFSTYGPLAASFDRFSASSGVQSMYFKASADKYNYMLMHTSWIFDRSVSFRLMAYQPLWVI